MMSVMGVILAAVTTAVLVWFLSRAGSRQHRPADVRVMERIKVVDHLVYLSDDGWKTIWVQYRGGNRRHRVTDKKEADMARLLAAAQSSGGRP